MHPEHETVSIRARRDGLRLAKDDKACEDIDECAEGTAKCEHGCRNLDPRITGLPYVCTCPDGLAVDPADQYHCIKQAQPRLGLYFRVDMPSKTLLTSTTSSAGSQAHVDPLCMDTAPLLAQAGLLTPIVGAGRMQCKL